MILVLSGTTVTAAGPGVDTGGMGNVDTYWSTLIQAQPGGWSCVYLHNDNNAPQGTWMTGESFWNVWYRDFGGGEINQGDYDYYIKELTMPWIAVQWHTFNNGVKTNYQYDEKPQAGGALLNHVMFTGNPSINGVFTGFVESNNQPGTPTTLRAYYVLDCDADNNVEFTFMELITLQGSPAQGVWGDVLMQITPASWPWIDFNGNGICDANEVGWHNMPGGGQDRIQCIDFAFLFDANVYDRAANDMYYWVVGTGWQQSLVEKGPGDASVCNGNGECALIDNPNAGRDIRMIPLIDGHDWGHYFLLKYTGGEYSQNPTTYVNGQNLQNTDGLFWYVEEFDVWNNNNFPPNGPAGVEFYDFQA
jgi:hypothetical protein